MCATVAGNRIEEIEKDTFKGLDHLRVLDLDRNRIYFIDARAFAAVPELRCLRLASNNIRVIYEDTFISVPHLQVTYTLHAVRAWIRTKLASLGDETQVWIWEFATLPSLSHRFPSLSFLHFLPPFSFLSSSSVPSPPVSFFPVNLSRLPGSLRHGVRYKLGSFIHGGVLGSHKRLVKCRSNGRCCCDVLEDDKQNLCRLLSLSPSCVDGRQAIPQRYVNDLLTCTYANCKYLSNCFIVKSSQQVRWSN